jgi:hypothetical protein
MEGDPTTNEAYTSSVDQHDRTLQSNINFVNGANNANNGTAFSNRPNRQRLGSTQSLVARPNSTSTDSDSAKIVALLRAQSQASNLSTPDSEPAEFVQMIQVAARKLNIELTDQQKFELLVNTANARYREDSENLRCAVELAHRHMSQERAKVRSRKSEERAMNRISKSQERSKDREQNEDAHDAYAEYEEAYNNAKGVLDLFILPVMLIMVFTIAVFLTVDALLASQTSDSLVFSSGKPAAWFQRMELSPQRSGPRGGRA